MNLLTKYTCHKEVHARPMNLGAYNEYRGWTLPKDENPHTEGYLVIYSLGTKDHHESWSPKHVFDEGYKATPEGYQNRVRSELEELETKINKLGKFLKENDEVSVRAHYDLVNDAAMLKTQFHAMQTYAGILRERIKQFPV